MSRKSRDLSAEEAALWRQVARDIVPLRKLPEFAHAPAPAAETAKRTPAPIAPTAATKKTPKTPPADRGGEKRARRGKLDVELSLDLHGYTQEKAKAALGRFLRRAQGEGARVVIVVTGKGGRLRSGEAAPGILKQRLPEWLASPALRPMVAGYAEAHARHGGAGAYYVFVRRGE